VGVVSLRIAGSLLDANSLLKWINVECKSTAAGMVEVKFPLRAALQAFGLYLSHATEAIKPMSKEARDEIGLTCQAQLETD
jgi:hypothetical protein